MRIKTIALSLAVAAAMSSSIALAATNNNSTNNFTQTISIAYGSNWLTQSQPHDTSGFRAMYGFFPNNWSWANNSLVASIQGSYAYWHTTTAISNSGSSNEHVFAVGPSLRWYFCNMSTWSPYLEAGVGPAVLSNSQFGDRLLGSKILFQDVGGIGSTFGTSKQFYASVNAIHYSNAGIHSENDGITVPVLLTVGYQFS